MQLIIVVFLHFLLGLLVGKYLEALEYKEYGGHLLLTLINIISIEVYFSMEALL